jgi:hypothetical protein
VDTASHNNPLPAATTSEYRLNVRAGGKTYSLDFQNAFFFGYSLLRARKFNKAFQVFRSLGRAGRDVPALAVLLSYCRAGLRDYGGSSALLCRTFPGGQREKAEWLHTAFVYLGVGMWTDAAMELSKVVRRYPDLPVACLLLGDVLAILRRRAKAVKCWQLAIARDRGGGPVAATARRLISSFTNRSAGH